MFPVWFDLFNVYLHSPFTASIIFDSLLEDLNGTTILTYLTSTLVEKPIQKPAAIPR